MEEDEKKVSRSPQFPFISLEKAIERVKAFEALYRTGAGRVGNVTTKVWGYSEKSSGATQTVGAVLGYGLLEDEGVLSERKLKLSRLGATILKDARPGAKEAAIREAAVKPKVFADLWAEWGLDRPPDAECVSILTLERGFVEEAAKRLLAIYDSNVTFAKLGASDKIEPPEPPENDDEPPPGDEKNREEKPGHGHGKRVPLMPNERVIYSHEIDPEGAETFRLLATGKVSRDTYEAMKAFAEFQLARLPKEGPKSDKQEDKPAG